MSLSRPVSLHSHPRIQQQLLYPFVNVQRICDGVDKNMLGKLGVALALGGHSEKSPNFGASLKSTARRVLSTPSQMRCIFEAFNGIVKI